MATLSLRRDLGPLTNDQIDDNFVDLNADIQTRLLSADAVSTNTLGKAVRRDEETGGFSAGAVTLTGINNTGNTNLGTDLTSTITLNGTVGAGVVISGSSTSDALRITQTGTGNALLIEDEANPDATPFVIAATGKVGIGLVPQDVNALNVGGSQGTGGISIFTNTENSGSYHFIFRKSRNATPGLYTIVQSGDTLGSILFQGDNGITTSSEASRIYSQVDGIPGTTSMPGRLIFATTSDGAVTPTERLRITSAGAVVLGGTYNNSVSFYNRRELTGAVTAHANHSNGTIQSDVTSTAYGYSSDLSTAAANFTLTNIKHFSASQATFGAGSVVTNQFGFAAEADLTGATNNFGFYGGIGAGTNRWNFYAAGTAQNYFLGNTGVGGLPSGSYNLEVTGTAYVSSHMTVNGNLTVNGTTTTVNSTIIAIDDPVFTLGGDTAPATDDSKDRGIEFRWHNGTDAKVGFFGFDRSTGKFRFIPDATNESEVFSGPKGTLDATIEWADILNKPATATTNSFGSVTTDNTDTEYTWTANGTATSGSAASNLKVVAGDGIQVHVDTTNNAVRITNDDTVDPTVFNENLTLSTNWQDTTINGADLSTGSYMVQITVNDSSVGGGQVNEIYTGMMSWYASDTDSTESDEVQLHRAGNGPGSGAIYLRIQRTATADANDLKLQIIGNTNNSGSATYTFKFRKLI